MLLREMPPRSFRASWMEYSARSCMGTSVRGEVYPSVSFGVLRMTSAGGTRLTVFFSRSLNACLDFYRGPVSQRAWHGRATAARLDRPYHAPTFLATPVITLGSAFAKLTRLRISFRYSGNLSRSK